MDNTPLSPWAYFGLEILYSIPIIGFIFLVCHALGASNQNKKNFAQSYFCFVIVIAVIVGIIFVIANASGWIEAIKNAIASL